MFEAKGRKTQQMTIDRTPRLLVTAYKHVVDDITLEQSAHTKIILHDLLSRGT